MDIDKIYTQSITNINNIVNKNNQLVLLQENILNDNSQLKLSSPCLLLSGNLIISYFE